MAGQRLEDLQAAPLAAAQDHAGRLKHDLGKYVALQQRWLPDDADPTARIEALRADLLATRRGPAGRQDAVSVWAEFRPGLVGQAPLAGGVLVDLSADPDVAAIDAAMGEIADVVTRLEASADVDVEAAFAAAARVAEHCRSLLRRARSH